MVHFCPGDFGHQIFLSIFLPLLIQEEHLAVSCESNVHKVLVTCPGIMPGNLTIPSCLLTVYLKHQYRALEVYFKV